MEQYNVTGMSCAACSARVEKAVKKVPGVTSCSVSLLTNSMGVEGTASPAAILSAVQEAGYGASPKNASASKASDASAYLDALADHETPKLKRRLIASLGFLLVQIVNTVLSYFIMIKPVLGSSYRQYILSLWLPFYLSLPTLAVSYGLGIILSGHLPLAALLAVQVAAGALAFVVMIVLSRNALVVEMKRQFCRNEKMKTLLRAG